MKTIYVSFLIAFIITRSDAQVPVKVDLAKLDRDHKIDVVNRDMKIITGATPVLQLSEKDNAGFAWLTGFEFTNGAIEFDAKGKDIFQQSFVGIAFHGADNQAYDCIYFRPFNFKADDAVRRSHSVQYISSPDYDWPVLREKFPNKYEQAVSPAPEPNDWFHVKITIKGSYFTVYVNNSVIPALYVQQLKPLSGKKIGLWVGNGSGGEWKNLVITPGK